MKKIIALLIIALFVLGCIQENADVKGELGLPFPLKINQTALISPEKLMLKLADVPQDSRCPSDVVCVWAGEATITLEAVKGVQLKTFNLTVGAGSQNDSADFAGYTITVVGLEPYPKASNPTKKSDYVATIQVVKALNDSQISKEPQTN